MTRTLFAAAAAMVVFAAPAHASEREFVKDGVTYTYTTTTQGDARVLKGYTSDGSEFKLTVRDGKVRGRVDGRYVSFTAPDAEPVAVAVAKR